MKKLQIFVFLLLPLFLYQLLFSEELSEILNLNKGKVVQLKIKGKKKEALRIGNGFLVEEGKFIITNLHLLSGGVYITADTGDGKKLDSILSYSPLKFSDLALLYTKKRDTNFFAMADLTRIGPGEKIYAISLKNIKNPQILEGNINTIYKLPQDITLYHLSFSCPNAFDGAPIFTEAGEIIGIVNTIGEEDSSLGVSIGSLLSLMNKEGQNLTGEDFSPLTELKIFHAISLIHNSRNEKASQLLNELSNTESTNPFVHFYVGMIKEANNQREEALKSYQKSIQLKPDFAEAHIKIGSLYEKIGEQEKAIESYKNALKVKIFPDAYYSLGLLYERMNKTEEAIESYKNYVLSYPEYAYRGYSRLSILYRLSGKFKDAMESAQKVLEKFPDDIDANYTFSFSAEKLGEVDKAVDGYLKLIKIDKKRAEDYYIYIVNALTKAEKYHRIVEISKDFIKNYPLLPSGYLNLGIAYIHLEDYQNAIEVLSKAIKIDPSNYSLQYNLGICYTRLGMSNEAINCFKECLKIKPNDSTTLYNLGVVSLQAGNFLEAKNALSSYLKINPEDVNAHYNLSIAFMNLQDYENASIHLKEVLKLDPQHYRARYNLGLSYFNKKDYKNAIDAFNSYLSFHPNDKNAIYNLAVAYLMGGFHSEAIQFFKKVISLDPNNALAHYNLGYTYLLLKNKFGALEEYNILQKLNPELAQKLKGFIEKIKE